MLYKPYARTEEGEYDHFAMKQDDADDKVRTLQGRKAASLFLIAVIRCASQC